MIRKQLVRNAQQALRRPTPTLSLSARILLNPIATSSRTYAQGPPRPPPNNGGFGGIRYPGQGGGGGGMSMSQGPEKGETLKQFSIDLTELARQGKLDPTIGRDEEIKRTIQILSRRTKSNPVLLGLPGGEFRRGFSIF